MIYRITEIMPSTVRISSRNQIIQAMVLRCQNYLYDGDHTNYIDNRISLREYLFSNSLA